MNCDCGNNFYVDSSKGKSCTFATMFHLPMADIWVPIYFFKPNCNSFKNVLF